MEMPRIFQNARGLVFKVHQFEEFGRKEAEKLVQEFEDSLAVLKAYLAQLDARENPPAASANKNNAPTDQGQPSNGDQNNGQPTTDQGASDASGQPSTDNAGQDSNDNGAPAAPATDTNAPDQGASPANADQPAQGQVVTPPAPTDQNQTQPAAPVDPTAQPAAPAVDPNQAQMQPDPNATFNIQ